MYYFEYNKEGYLYQYSEVSSGDTVINCFVTGSTIIRYEKEDEYKIFQKYTSSVKLLQRFEAGESWLTISVDIKSENNDIDEEYDELGEIIDRRFPDYYNKSNKSALEEFEIYYLNGIKVLNPILNKRIQIENDEVTEYKTKLDNKKIRQWRNLVNL